MQLVGVADIGPCLSANTLDGSRIERSQIGGIGRLVCPARVHRLGTALLERRIVEEGVGPRVQDLVRERRWLGQIARDATDLAPLESSPE